MSDLDHLLADLGRTAALPFEQATALPSGVYIDPAFTAREIEHLFKSDWVCVGRTDEVWDCNWKSLAENFIESYHLFSSHNTRCSRSPRPRASGANRARRAGTSTGWTPAACRRRPGPTPTTTTRARFPLMHVYPSHVVPASLNRGFWMSLQPDEPDCVRVLWSVTTTAPLWPKESPEHAAMRAEIKETFDRVNMEDRTIVESIARSLKSDRVVSGRLGEKEHTIWEFQRFLARALGAPVSAAAGAAE